jgi:GAF domain-containing protein
VNKLSGDARYGIAEPLAVVSASGETLEANPAFGALAARANRPPGLTQLFVAETVHALIAEALREGHARAFLPLQGAADPRPWFRMSFNRDPGRETVTVLMLPLHEEMTWRRQLDERNRELAMLRVIGTALSGAFDIEDIAERIYAQTTLITQSGNFYIALYDRSTNMVSFPRYIENGVWQEMTARPFGNGLTEYILRTGKPLLFSRDVMEQAVARGIEPQGRPCCAWIGVPMINEDETVGVIGLQDFERTNVYDEHDLELLGIIAGQAAAAIKNSRLLASARLAYQELSETQARLLETERVRGVTETVGALNHEVNNPLAVIAGNAQLLLRKADTLPPEAVAKVESILDAARRIQRVTGKMATLIQATSMPYPGEGSILDVHRSIAGGAEGTDAAARPESGPQGDERAA